VNITGVTGSLARVNRSRDCMTDGRGRVRRVDDLARTGRNEGDGESLREWLPNSRLERPGSAGRSA